ncbi:MAG: ferrochelatase [Myxococcaceae bacterium]
MAKFGLLLINIGTPDAPTVSAVRRYLREFLSDPRVVDIPAPLRWLLLEGVILPTRPRTSAEAYRKVWTAAGSPLLANSQALANALRSSLGSDWQVEVGMRYGQPDLAQALQALAAANVERLVVFPLYPQYSSSATGSGLEKVFDVLGAREDVPALSVVPPFFNQPGFVDAWHQVAEPFVREHRPEHVLFSFHGLPERQVQKTDSSRQHCLRVEGCCERPNVEADHFCYRRQAFRIAGAIAGRLSLDPKLWSVSFQSRLGRTPWLKPFTDERLPQLARSGVRRVLVVCPSFVADCLETLEEMGIRGQALFKQAGGEALVLVPSLNANVGWVSFVTQMARAFSGPPSAEVVRASDHPNA